MESVDTPSPEASPPETSSLGSRGSQPALSVSHTVTVLGVIVLGLVIGYLLPVDELAGPAPLVHGDPDEPVTLDEKPAAAARRRLVRARDQLLPMHRASSGAPELGPARRDHVERVLDEYLERSYPDRVARYIHALTDWLLALRFSVASRSRQARIFEDPAVQQDMAEFAYEFPVHLFADAMLLVRATTDPRFRSFPPPATGMPREEVAARARTLERRLVDLVDALETRLAAWAKPVPDPLVVLASLLRRELARTEAAIYLDEVHRRLGSRPPRFAFLWLARAQERLLGTVLELDRLDCPRRRTILTETLDLYLNPPEGLSEEERALLVIDLLPVMTGMLGRCQAEIDAAFLMRYEDLLARVEELAADHEPRVVTAVARSVSMVDIHQQQARLHGGLAAPARETVERLRALWRRVGRLREPGEERGSGP